MQNSKTTGLDNNVFFITYHRLTVSLVSFFFFSFIIFIFIISFSARSGREGILKSQ